MADMIKLNRGGICVHTPLGHVQFGSPSETLKDTLTMKGGVPEYFVLSEELVSLKHGISLADIEFPVFYHLFGHNRPLKLIARPEVAGAVRQAIQESLIGPNEADLLLEQDFPEKARIPDLLREWNYFRQGPYKNGLLSMDDALEIIPIEKGRARIAKDVVLHEDENHFALEWTQGRTDHIDKKIHVPEKEIVMSKNQQTFHPPEFGVTVLGRSNGFDPDPRERTTGFILWLGGRGIMVDPPVHSLQFMQENGIDPQLVQSVLLTHCHSDHDSGLLQCAMFGQKITVYTTPNIYASYRRKWSILAAIPETEFARLINFRSVRVGVSTPIENGEFIFRYTLHSIPTIGFEVHFGGLSCNYSSDTLNDKEAIEAMYQDGGIEKERREELLHFDWDHDIVLHESGIPPLHTPIEILKELPEDVRRRVFVVHATPSKHEQLSELQFPKPGAQGTLSYTTLNSKEDALRRKLSLLSDAKLFESLPVTRILELMDITTDEFYSRGDFIVQDGDESECIYVLASGRAAVIKDSKELKVYGVADYIGETGVFLRKRRNADVVAKTDVHVLAIDGARCRALCRGTQIPVQVKRHEKVRDWGAWAFFENHPFFSELTVTQKTELESYLRPYVWKEGKVIHQRGRLARRLVLVIDGEVSTDKETNACYGAGQMLGTPQQLLDSHRYDYRAVVSKTATVLCLDRTNFQRFIKNNPGVLVRLQPWRIEEHRERRQNVTERFLEEFS